MTRHEKHMQLIDAVNNATNPTEKRLAECRLEGWRDGVRDAGGRVDLIGADWEQIERGHGDRLMCCGVFLDEPQPAVPQVPCSRAPETRQTLRSCP